jgi:hypothetical protein
MPARGEASGPLVITQLGGADPTKLTIPSFMMERFQLIKKLSTDGDPLPDAFIGAAVLSDEDQLRPNAELVDLAIDLINANFDIGEPDDPTPIVAINGTRLHAGLVPPKSNMHFRHINSAIFSASVAVVPCKTTLKVEIDRGKRIDVATTETSTDQPLEVIIPPHVLTVDNHGDGHAQAIGRNMLSGHGVMAFGREAIEALFSSAVSPNRGSKGAGDRRDVAWQAVELLELYGFGVSLDPKS